MAPRSLGPAAGMRAALLGVLPAAVCQDVVAGGLASDAELKKVNRLHALPISAKYEHHKEKCVLIFPMYSFQGDDVKECTDECDENNACSGVDWCRPPSGVGKYACSLKPKLPPPGQRQPFMPTAACPGGCDCRCDWYDKRPTPLEAAAAPAPPPETAAGAQSPGSAGAAAPGAVAAGDLVRVRDSTGDAWINGVAVAPGSAGGCRAKIGGDSAVLPWTYCEKR
eukprot:TRINITY_DN24764_c0_g1_i1.p1 TRINITY_DN24764_c0_g1~~TRINITY_DN24764_c0_g1_i1.p1  ORF type:complete len:250 (+),score=78.26 TRINITY_DN24764_c0_g1_i1:80-751(+)